MNPYDVLNVSPDATLDELKERYRDLVKLHHPDHGGTVEKFMEVRRAYATLMELCSKPQSCKTCKGTGFVDMPGTSFTSMQQVCSECCGKGRI